MKSALLSASVFFAAAGAFANPASGIIEICRSPGMVSLKDKTSLTIPAHSNFVQDIPHSNRIGSVITLLHDAAMNPKATCMRASAIVIQPSPYAPPITGRTVFLPQLGEHAELVTRAVEGFK